MADGDDAWRLESADGTIARAATSRLTLEVPRAAALRACGLGVAALRGIPRASVSRLLRLRPAPTPRRRAAHLSRPARYRSRGGALAAGRSARRRRRQGRRRYHWAALDCPGYFAVSDGRQAMLLGEMQAHSTGACARATRARSSAGGSAPRAASTMSGTAIFDVEGELCARASATWIAIESPGG